MTPTVRASVPASPSPSSAIATIAARLALRYFGQVGRAVPSFGCGAVGSVRRLRPHGLPRRLGTKPEVPPTAEVLQGRRGVLDGLQAVGGGRVIAGTRECPDRPHRTAALRQGPVEAGFDR